MGNFRFTLVFMFRHLKKMYSKMFFDLFLFVINSYFLVSTAYMVPDLRFVEESGAVGDDSKINETYSLQQPVENGSTSVREEEILFWMVPTKVDTEEIRLDNNTNSEKTDVTSEEAEPLEGSINETLNDIPITTSKPPASSNVDQTAEENNKYEALPNVTAVMSDPMDEKLTLQRNNCYLEIMVQETHDIKIQIVFGKLENNTSGKCCITLNGEENSMLGVLISNIRLYQNASQGEILRVIIADYGSDFILKEYYPWSKYQPLILTETHRVYIVLHYKVKNVPLSQQNSHFNLEVFSYHKYENYIQQGSSYTQSYVPHNNDMGNFFKIRNTPF